MKQLFFSLAIISACILSSCEKKNPPVDITDEMARDSLYNIMNYWYYWYREMPVVDKNEYINPYHLLQNIRYKELDKWSFVADYNEFISEMSGEFYGHGISVGVDENDNARIVMIYSNSPLYNVGVRRGWLLKSINGFDIANIIKEKDNVTYNYIFSQTTGTFVFEKPDGSPFEYTSSKSEFIVNTVLHYDTLQLSSGVAGHLVLESFKASSSDELREAFTYFINNGVNSLILDLRYNGGGYLTVANELSSYIVGNTLSSQVFATLQYNDKRSRSNVSNLFTTTTLPLNLSNIVVIASRSTASASEALINGLEPYIEVIQVGDTTYGKPMGMDGWYCGKKYVFYPVTFKLVNAEGKGDYFEGLFPDIIVADDIKHDFNDRREASLREAIEYLETGIIPPTGTKGFSRTKYFSEKSEWSSNMFGGFDPQ